MIQRGVGVDAAREVEAGSGLKASEVQEPEIRKENGRLDSSGFGLVDLVCGSSLRNADSREFWGSLISEHWKPSMTSLVPLPAEEGEDLYSSQFPLDPFPPRATTMSANFIVSESHGSGEGWANSLDSPSPCLSLLSAFYPRL